MTKREDIQDTIYNIIKEHCKASGGVVTGKAYASDLIMDYLHSQDVVFIKDGELPVITKKGWYYLTEPLIEES